MLVQNAQGLIRELAEFAERGVGPVHPPEGQGLIHVVQLPIMGDAVKDVGLLADVEAFVKPAALPCPGIGRQPGQSLAPDHGRGHGNPLSLHERAEDHAARGPGLGEEALEHTSAVKNLRIRADQPHPLIGFEQGHLFFQFLRTPEIVAVQKSQIAAARLSQGQIARGAQGHGLFTAKIAQPGTVAPGDGRAVVRGSIVPEDDFKILKALGHEAVQGRAQIPRAVQAVHDHGDGGSAHGLAPSEVFPEPLRPRVRRKTQYLQSR